MFKQFEINKIIDLNMTDDLKYRVTTCPTLIFNEDQTSVDSFFFTSMKRRRQNIRDSKI